MKRAAIAVGLAVLTGAALWGCASPKVTDYQSEKPKLDLVSYFTGRTEAWGMVQKRGGEVTKRFHVVVQGRVENGNLIMEEDFTYSDGEKQQRTWTIEPLPGDRWRGTAGDVVGEANGQTSGNALHWRYVLQVPVNGKVYDLHMDDWMYLVDEHTLINRTTMSKFGVDVGEVTIFFRKP
jgi:hypothetical protein